jgi:hypothetical protein
MRLIGLPSFLELYDESDCDDVLRVQQFQQMEDAVGVEGAGPGALFVSVFAGCDRAVVSLKSGKRWNCQVCSDLSECMHIQVILNDQQRGELDIGLSDIDEENKGEPQEEISRFRYPFPYHKERRKASQQLHASRRCQSIEYLRTETFSAMICQTCSSSLVDAVVIGEEVFLVCVCLNLFTGRS